MSPIRLLRWLPVVVYCGESIFEYNYLRKYETKIKNVYTLVCGPQDVLLGIKKLKKSGLLDCPFKLTVAFSSVMSQVNESNFTLS